MRHGWMIEINKELASKLWHEKEYFSKGKRGYIYLTKEKKYVIKARNPESKAPNTIYREYENNKTLNNYKVGPEMYYYDEENDFVIREFVDGENLFEWIIKIKDKKKIERVLIDLLEQCRRMDDARINKLEMTNPHKDLLIRNDLPVIIDFERCKQTINPKNVTQVCQFITSKHVNSALKNFDAEINKEKILRLAENYKKEILKDKKEIDSYEKIKEEIKKSFN
jgi:predicted Ser/Thr protein kinase